jgi:peptide/nickel transport system permease protein
MPEQPPESAGTALADDVDRTGLVADAVTVEIAGVTAGVEPARKKKLGLGAWLAIVWLAGLILAAIIAPILPIAGPNETFTSIQRAQAPFSTINEPGGGTTTPFAEGHILGGDRNGHDLLSRAIYGARNSLIVGFGAVGFGILLGGLLGLFAGFYRGRVDAVIVAFLDIMLAIPALVLALSLTAVLRGRVDDLLILVIALGVISVPILGRITRANTLVWSEREFVTAARAQGAKNWRIMTREVLPNVLPAMFSIALLGVAIVIAAEAALRLLGIGLSITDPSWGGIINDGRDFLTQGITAHVVFVGSAFIFLTILSTFGRRRFDTSAAARERQRHRALPYRVPRRAAPRRPRRQDVLPVAAGRRARGRRRLLLARPGTHAGSRRRVGIGQDGALALGDGTPPEEARDPGGLDQVRGPRDRGSRRQ